MRRLAMSVLVAAVVGIALEIASHPAEAELWDGPKLAPTTREETFEFAAEPTFGPLRAPDGKAVPDRYEVRFASKTFCDVCVDILDAAGRVIRHLAYGVLGSNAPPPFEPDRLDQSIVWNCKDDAGNYVPAAASCKARVRLGLAAKFDKLLGWHPKNTNSAREVQAISAGPDGVYVLTGGDPNRLRAFDHNGNYVRTLVPFRADKIDEFKRADLTCVVKLPDGSLHYYPGSGPGEGSGSQRHFFGNHYIPAGPQRMAVVNGKIALAGGGGILTARRVMRIGIDGSLVDGRFYGGYLTTGGAKARAAPTRGDIPGAIDGPNALAASPDGQWLYATGFDGMFQAVSNHLMTKSQHAAISRSGSYGISGTPVHAVYRIPWDQVEGGLGETFFGEPRTSGADEKHLNGPADLATDAAGNLYVADEGNDRVQVFSPDAKLLRSIPIKRPHALDIDRRTGCLYVLSVDEFLRKPNYVTIWRTRLVKLDADGKRRFEQPFECYGPSPVFCVDGWADVPTIWLTRLEGQIALYADRGDRLELIDDFAQDVRQAGQTPFYSNGSWRLYLAADPIRPHLYLVGNGLWRFDVETGQYAPCRNFPLFNDGVGGLDDFAIGPTGLVYGRTTGYLFRVDPADNWREVPLDYGEPVGKGFEGGIKFPWPAGLHFHMGMGVAHNGDIIAMGFWGPSAIIAKIGDLFMPQGAANALPKWDPDNDWFKPILYPGRPKMDGSLVCVWNAKGEAKLFDAIKGVPANSSGLRGDREGNIYLGYGGDKYGPDGKLIYGRTLVKFSPAGGKFVSADFASVPLGERPARPPEIRGFGMGGTDLWTKGLLWSYGGINVVPELGKCICPNTRFDVDWYGRVFVAEAHRNSVAVLDTNGNFALRIGRYGNADSGLGPDSPIPVGGDEIALSHCTYVTSDAKGNWLYLSDGGSERIIRVRLTYQVEKTVSAR